MHITSNEHVQAWETQSHFQRFLRKAVALADAPSPEVESLVRAAAEADCAALIQRANRFLGDAQRVVWLGMGGASLGGQALAQWQSATAPTQPQLIFADRLDAPGLKWVLQDGLAQTRFVVVSKSGTTVETCAQLDMVLDALAKAKLSPQTHIIGITGDGAHRLRARADAAGFALMPHSAVGGRYAVCSAVGLWPAHWAGMDIAAFQTGLGAGLARTRQAAQGAAWHAMAQSKGCNLNILLAFGARHFHLGEWYLQLWAESLGKTVTASTPVLAIAPRDLHSQWQLYLAGAADKFYTLLLDGDAESDTLILAQAAMVQAELAQAKRPCRIIELDGTAHGLGQAMGFWMLETIITAGLLGVSPFGQPAVDAGKRTVQRALAQP